MSCQTLQVTVLFVNGDRRMYEIPENSTVDELVSIILKDTTISIPIDKTVTILYLGRLLNGDDRFTDLEDFHEFTVNCFFRKKSEKLAEIQVEEPDLRGFERLSRLNYSADQIRSIRNQFHSINGSQNMTVSEQADIEEEWFPAIFDEVTGNTLDDTFREAINIQNEDEATVSPRAEESEGNDTWITFISGFVLGFFFSYKSVLLLPLIGYYKTLFIGIVFGSCFGYLYSR